MKQIGIVQAKSRFSEIARHVKETGEPVRVINRGKEIVDITPIPGPSHARRTPKQAFAELSRLRRKLPKASYDNIKADIEEGRR